MMNASQPSPAYNQLLTKLESIAGAVPGVPHEWSYYWDSAGVATIGYGHALQNADGSHIHKKDVDAEIHAKAAITRLFGRDTFTTSEALSLMVKDRLAFSVKVCDLVAGFDTLQNEFDALLDFGYNCGLGALADSTLLRMHKAGQPIGPTKLSDLRFLMENSQQKKPITSIGQAFAAWSNDSGHWSLGVFHRRMVEFLMYAGHDYSEAYSTAFSISA